MSGSSMKDIRLRIKSVESTRQITKAMQLVATSKMRRSKERMEGSKPYAQISAGAFAAALKGCRNSDIMFVKQREIKRRLFVVIAGDRGLAGGYNNNVFKAVESSCGGIAYDVLPVGKKAIEKYRNTGVKLIADCYVPVAGTRVGTCYGMAQMICDGYRNGDYDEVLVVYTTFKSMLTQEVQVRKLLPVAIPEETDGPKVSPVYEPDPETMVENIIPDLIAGDLYSCICDACASENAMRRNAMESATKNADEMISGLSLKYNRARQGSITQEITEIVAGAEK